MTKAEAIAAAQAVGEARVVVARHADYRTALGRRLDQDLYTLEHVYWRACSDAEKKVPKPRRRKQR